MGRRSLVVALLLCCLGFLWSGSPLQAADPAPQTHDIDATGVTWEPGAVTAELGDELRWNFPAATAQTVHDVWVVPPGGDPAPGGDIFQVTPGLVLPGGASVQHTLDKEGTWTFVCRVHSGFSDGRWVGMVGTAQVGDKDAVEFEPYKRPDPTLPKVPSGAVKRFVVDVYEHVTKVSDDLPPTRVWSFGVNGALNRGTGVSTPIVVNQHDEVEIELRNGSSAEMGVSMPHSIDLHAAHAAPNKAFASIPPGATHTFRFTADNAGVFMYHCGSDPVLHHVGAGMAGMIVVKPPDLKPVDRELWVLQQEFYLGEPGHDPDFGKMLDQKPDVIAFNGYANQYVAAPIEVDAGERIRLYVLNAGPTIWSAFHVIGTVFDRAVTDNGAMTDVQTVNLAPSQGGFVEFSLRDPGNYPFVNHSFGNAVKGSIGVLAAGPRRSSPTVHAFADPVSGPAPLHVRFSATGYDPDGGALSYRWDLDAAGGGGSVLDQRFEHTFTEPGSYTATVTARDAHGSSSSETVRVTVTAATAGDGGGGGGGGVASPTPAPGAGGAGHDASHAGHAGHAAANRTAVAARKFGQHGVKLAVTCGSTAKGQATVTVSKATAKRLRLPRRTVASGTVRCVGGRNVALTLRPARSTARRLTGAKRVPATVTVTVGRERVRKAVVLTR
ncbi:MAG TPA: PKD domain-containing protein [Solirubrobacter sp.]|nr:PKD domain-containing protein [Solirubrobacter sp.]